MFCGKRKTNGRIEGGGKMPPELSQTTRHFQNRFSLGPKILGNLGNINKSKVDRNCAQSWIFKLFIFHGSFLPHLVIAHVVSAAIKSGLYCRDHHKGHHKILYIALAVDAIYGWCYVFLWLVQLCIKSAFHSTNLQSVTTKYYISLLQWYWSFAAEIDSRVATKYNALQMTAITPPVLYSRDHLKGSPLLKHGKAQISNYNCVSPDFQFKMLISHTQCSNGMT